MIEYLSDFWVLLINSAFFGLFTKLADLCNEHKWNPFRGAALLFGFLWGIFGAAVVIANPLLGSFYLAILFHWILRNKIDRLNHGIGSVIILISFVFVSETYQFDWYLFSFIFIVYTIFGLLRDNRKIRSSWFTKLNIYAYLIVIIFTLLDQKYLIVLLSYFFNTLFYQLAKKLENGEK